MSPGGDQAWLGDGMAEELIETLSRIEALRVPGRTSSFSLRGKNIRTVGEALNVGSVVEGSVRRSGDALRVTAQLIRVEDGYHLWSARYDQKLEDVFAIQTKIARAVAEAIRGEFGIEYDASWLRSYEPRDVRAYELVKKGLEARLLVTEEGIQKAIDYHRRAVAIDPEYAQGHAELGFAYFERGLLRSRDPEGRARARAEAERALAIDATNGSAHNLLGFILMMEWDWEGARGRFERGIDLNPGHGPLKLGLGLLLMEQGELEQALVQMRSAVNLDPMDAFTNGLLGVFYLIVGDYTAATEQLKRTQELAPGIFWVNDCLLIAYHYAGMEAEALAAALQGAPAELAAAIRAGYQESGWLGLVRSLFDWRLAQSGKPCTNNPMSGAFLLAHLGEAEQMLGCLGQAVERRNTFLKVFPSYAPYRDDPRFTALLRRMGLEE
jgi:TolB-like protein/Flp pilus assembly protein TadD